MSIDPRRWILSSQPLRTQVLVYVAAFLAVGSVLRAVARDDLRHIPVDFPYLLAALAVVCLMGHESEKRRKAFAADGAVQDLSTTWRMLAILILTPAWATAWILASVSADFLSSPSHQARAAYKKTYSASTIIFASATATSFGHAPLFAASVYYGLQKGGAMLYLALHGAPARMILNRQLLMTEAVLTLAGVILRPEAGPHIAVAVVFVAAATALHQVGLQVAIVRAFNRDGLVRDVAWFEEAIIGVLKTGCGAVLIFDCGQQNRRAAAIAARDVRTGTDWVTIRTDGVYVYVAGVGVHSLRGITHRITTLLDNQGIVSTSGGAAGPADGGTVDQLIEAAATLLAARQALHEQQPVI